MKILLLGAKGNLGTVFLNSALDYPEHSFIGWDKEDIDVTDTSLLNKKISEIKPNVIINTVAYNDVDKCETNEESAALAEALNVQLVRSLAEVAIEHNCLLLHFSSDYVFSGDVETGYSETTEPSPINIYGKSNGCPYLICGTCNGSILFYSTQLPQGLLVKNFTWKNVPLNSGFIPR
jgi:dTDP-4-dehydrorhamnose reductase